MGSKNRIAKHLLPIMLAECEKHNITKWVEPFVGGANMLDIVPDAFERIEFDLNPHTIAALIGIRDHIAEFPEFVSEEFYKSVKKTEAHPVNSWIRFECSFGAKLDNGYARNAKGANYAKIGLNLAIKQSPKIQNVQFICDSYENLSFDNCLIYCDPPYFGTKWYRKNHVPKMDHDKFFNWCREQAKKNIVFVSEYNAPDDFIEVWRGEIKTNFASTRKTATHNAIEKLFRVK